VYFSAERLEIMSGFKRGRTGAVAKRVLEGILPGTMEYQPEQSHGEYDFELRYHGGTTTAAVEVTAAVDRTLVQTIAAIRGRGKVPFIQAVKCKKSWAILPAKDANIGKIREAADECLSRVEQERIGSFFWVRDFEHQCVQDVCRELRITSGSVIPTGVSPKIRIQLPGGGGAVGASIAIEAGEKEAWEKGNRDKLGAAKTAERHLVVYIDAMNGLLWVPLTDFDPPSALPNLPQEITHLWLVAHGGKADEFVVWHASAEKSWRSLRRSLPEDSNEYSFHGRSLFASVASDCPLKIFLEHISSSCGTI
jgi:hypothetical protein